MLKNLIYNGTNRIENKINYIGDLKLVIGVEVGHHEDVHAWAEGRLVAEIEVFCIV